MRLEDRRLRGKRIGYLQCGDYRGMTLDGAHLIQVTCVCGTAWVETARSVWTGRVTQCGCKGSDEATLKAWFTLPIDAGYPGVYYPHQWLESYWTFRSVVGLAPCSSARLKTRWSGGRLDDPGNLYWLVPSSESESLDDVLRLLECY